MNRTQKPAVEPPEKINRPLGPSETAFWLGDLRCSFNFIMHACIEGPVDAEAVRAGLREVQRRHGLLRVRLLRRGRSGAEFDGNGVGEIPLREMERPEGGWPAVAEEELRLRFDVEKGPLARCVLVKAEGESPVLLVAFHHLIADAMSGVYFLRDLMEAMRPSPEGRGPRLAESAPKRELDFYVPASHRGIRGLLLLLLQALRLLRRFLLRGAPAAPEALRPSPPEDRRALLVPRSLDAQDAGMLLLRARSEGATVHGALAAAFVRAIAEETHADGAGFFLTGSDVDLRPLLAPEIGEEIGMYISGVFTPVSIRRARDRLWEAARAISRSVHESIDAGEPYLAAAAARLMMPLLGVVGTGERGMKLVSDGGYRTGSKLVVLSNIGRLKVEVGSVEPRVTGLGFASSMSVFGSIGLFAATYNGRMTLNVVDMEPGFPRECAERLADRVIGILRESCSAR